MNALVKVITSGIYGVIVVALLLGAGLAISNLSLAQSLINSAISLAFLVVILAFVGKLAIKAM